MTSILAASFWIAVFVAIAAFFLEFVLPPEAVPGTVGAVAPAHRTSDPARRRAVAADTAFAPRRMRLGAGALPPTIRQRIRSEAHDGLSAMRREVLDLSYATPRVPRRVDEFELTD